MTQHASSETNNDALVVETDGGVRVVRLNRPHAGNALDEPLHRRFVDVWTHIAGDPDARVVVLTGTGRTFCAGGDFGLIEATAQSTAEEKSRTLAEAKELVVTMLNFPLPVVAAVNGPAIGLGASIVSLCDIVYMADTAFLSDPHLALGLVPGDGAAITWPVLMSLLRAREFLFTGDRISAELAERLGLANRVLDVDEVHPQALALAHRLAELPAYATQATKRVLNAALLRSAEATLDFALTAENLTFYTPEHAARVAALKGRLSSRGGSA